MCQKISKMFAECGSLCMQKNFNYAKNITQSHERDYFNVHELSFIPPEFGQDQSAFI